MSKKTNELEIEDISTPSQIVKINKSGVVDLSTLSQEKIDELTERANNVTPENILNLGADARSQISSAADVFLDKVRTSEVDEFGMTIKRDGSSFTQFTMFDKEAEMYVNEICSRNQIKDNGIRIVGFKNDVEEFHKFFDKDTKTLIWKGKETGIIKTEDELNNDESVTPITEEVKDAWIELSKQSGLYDNSIKYCEKHGVELAFRAEIFGQGLKGSGNKNNPDAKEKPTLELFGIDNMESGFSVRQHLGDKHNLEKVATEIDVPYTTIYKFTPKSFEDIIKQANELFASEKKEGRIIVGVVIRTLHSNAISCKYLNDEYDASK